MRSKVKRRMPKHRRSKEYRAFDAVMGDLLSVSKADLDARMQAHKELAALNPRKRGPKPKVKTTDDVSLATGDAV